MLINQGSAPRVAPPAPRNGGAPSTAGAAADGEHDARHWERGVTGERRTGPRLYAELASEGSAQEFEQRMSDDALGRFLDPEIEWVPVTESLLAVDSYRGFDRVRRFLG